MSRRILSIVLAGALWAGPAFAQEDTGRGTAPRLPAAPRAADQTLGTAVMSAVVLSDGTLFSGTGVKSVVKAATGQYDVVFVRSVLGCTSVASIVADGGPGLIRPENYISNNPLAPDLMRVFTRNVTSDSSEDHAFSLIVFCAK